MTQTKMIIKSGKAKEKELYLTPYSYLLVYFRISILSSYIVHTFYKQAVFFTGYPSCFAITIRLGQDNLMPEIEKFDKLYHSSYFTVLMLNVRRNNGMMIFMLTCFHVFMLTYTSSGVVCKEE